MAWLYLLAAGLFEIAWAVGLKFTDGFTRPLPTVWVAVSTIASFWLLAMALRSLPVGMAYAIWTGIGTVGTVAISIGFLGEYVSPLKVACVALIVVGMIGLKLASPE